MVNSSRYMSIFLSTDMEPVILELAGRPQGSPLHFLHLCKDMYWWANTGGRELDARKGRQIRINLRGGEATERGGGYRDSGAGDHKGPPRAAPPPSPLRMAINK